MITNNDSQKLIKLYNTYVKALVDCGYSIEEAKVIGKDMVEFLEKKSQHRLRALESELEN